MISKSKLSKRLLIKGENRKEFEEFSRKLLEEIPVHSEIENILREKFIISAWKLERSIEIERNILNEQNKFSPYDFDMTMSRKRIRNIKRIKFDSPEIQQIHQHQQDLEKSMHKNLERLREEQRLKVDKVQDKLAEK